MKESRPSQAARAAPAWDPDFNSADFFMLLAMSQLNPRYTRHFGYTAGGSTRLRGPPGYAGHFLFRADFEQVIAMRMAPTNGSGGHQAKALVYQRFLADAILKAGDDGL